MLNWILSSGCRETAGDRRTHAHTHTLDTQTFFFHPITEYVNKNGLRRILTKFIFGRFQGSLWRGSNTKKKRYAIIYKVLIAKQQSKFESWRIVYRAVYLPGPIMNAFSEVRVHLHFIGELNNDYGVRQSVPLDT